jgi:MSHA pilin protein MshD
MKRNHGFTLIEVIIFIVVVTVGLVGILSVMDTSVRSSADPMVRKQTLAIAESMLEEILQKEFADPDGNNAGEAGRADWDNVADYNGYATAAGIEDSAGTAVPNLGGYNIAPPVVVAVAAAGTDNANLIAAGARRVTVSVTGPGGTITLVGYRAAP